MENDKELEEQTLEEKRREEAEEARQSEIEALDAENDDVFGVGDEKVVDEE